MQQAKLQIDSDTNIMEAGESKQFLVKLNEKYIENAKWSSSNDALLSITENGIATAHKKGKVNITVTYDNLTDEIEIEITETPVNIFYKNYQIDKQNIKVYFGIENDYNVQVAVKATLLINITSNDVNIFQNEYQIEESDYNYIDTNYLATITIPLEQLPEVDNNEGEIHVTIMINDSQTFEYVLEVDDLPTTSYEAILNAFKKYPNVLSEYDEDGNEIYSIVVIREKYICMFLVSSNNTMYIYIEHYEYGVYLIFETSFEDKITNGMVYINNNDYYGLDDAVTVTNNDIIVVFDYHNLPNSSAQSSLEDIAESLIALGIVDLQILLLQMGRTIELR